MALKEQVPNVYSVGLRNVGSYQVSGQPYLSGAITTANLGSNVDGYYVFPTVTKKVIVSNEDSTNNAIVSFAPFLEGEVTNYSPDFTAGNSASGSGNWLFLSASTSIELDVKCKEIYVAPAQAVAVNFVTVYAELTGIKSGSMYSFNGLEGITT